MDIENTCTAIETVVNECGLATLETFGKFHRAVKLSSGIMKLKSLISEEFMKNILPLQNTPLGFRTDKQDGYPFEVVRDAFIEATLRGLSPIGNEFNIIAGRFYATKEGFTRLLKDMNGLTDLRISLGVPKTTTGGAVITASASWNLNGKPDRLEKEIPVKVNNGMGVDAILGKAERKLKAAIFSHITGSSMSDGDVSDPAIIAPARNEDLNEKLKNASTVEPIKELTDAQKSLSLLAPATLAQARGRLNISTQINQLSDEQCSNLLDAATELVNTAQSKKDDGRDF